MTRALFDPVWWWLTIPAAVGIGLFYYGNRHRDRTVLLGGVGVFVLTVVWGLVSYFVQTDIEKVTTRTRQLVLAVETSDWTTFASLLDARTNFAKYRNREELVRGAQGTAEKIGLTRVLITGITSNQTDSVIDVNIDVVSEQEITYGRPMRSSWRFDWQQRGDEWLLTRIEPLESGDLSNRRVNQELVPRQP